MKFEIGKRIVKSKHITFRIWLHKLIHYSYQQFKVDRSKFDF